MRRSHQCFISAGEASGDLLAAELVMRLKTLFPDLRFSGLAGPAMIAAGVQPLATIDELSAMGLWDVAMQAPELRMLERRVLSFADRVQPCLALLVDYPGLHFRFAEQLHLRGVPVVQYVAPKLWAWGEQRSLRLKRDFSAVLGILPFEEEFFRSRGVAYHYVGCPLRERVAGVRVQASDLGLAGGEGPLVACLPGSRWSEVRRILPLMAQIKQGFRALHPRARFLVPVPNSLPFAEVSEFLPPSLREGMVFIQEKSLEVMALADVAIVASGTATLECALLNTPMAVVYKMDELSYQIAKSKLKTKWVSLVNLLLGREAVKEFIQAIDVASVVSELANLLPGGAGREPMLAAFQQLDTLLLQGVSSALDHLAPFLTASLTSQTIANPNDF